MARNDRFLQYVEAQRKARSLERAANYVFLGIVVVVLAGSAIGLIPEVSKSHQLDQKIAEWETTVHKSSENLQREKSSLTLLSSDVGFVEQEFRNRSLRLAKPGETLILLPPDQIEVYEGVRPHP